jgi:hypothetical protein
MENSLIKFDNIHAVEADVVHDLVMDLVFSIPSGRFLSAAQLNRVVRLHIAHGKQEKRNVFNNNS